jgi:membrane protein DedA with SNARE-associated domain
VIEAFLMRWGYLAVGVGTLLEGEAVLLTAGAFAHRGALSLPFVIVAAFIGSVGGDQLYFQLGRRLGRPYLDRKPSWRRSEQRIEPWLHRYGNGFVFGFRFAYGLRTVTPIALGVSGYPFARFLLFNTLGGMLWAGLFATAGWAMGASLAQALGRMGHAEEIAALAVLLTIGLWCLHRAIAARVRHGVQVRA